MNTAIGKRNNPRSPMTLDRAVMAFAGAMVLLSLALTYFVSPWFWILTAFVGINLFQSAFTGFCPAAMVMKRMGIGRDAGAAGSR